MKFYVWSYRHTPSEVKADCGERAAAKFAADMNLNHDDWVRVVAIDDTGFFKVNVGIHGLPQSPE